MKGYRHTTDTGRECLCGCQWVEGLDGEIRDTEDNRKLRDLGLVYVTFQTPYSGETTICYDRETA